MNGGGADGEKEGGIEKRHLHLNIIVIWHLF